MGPSAPSPAGTTCSSTRRRRRASTRATPAGYPEFHHVTAPLRAVARERGDADGFHLWAGQAHTLAEALPAGELVRDLAADAAEALEDAARRLSNVLLLLCTPRMEFEIPIAFVGGGR